MEQESEPKRRQTCAVDRRALGLTRENGRMSINKGCLQEAAEKIFLAPTELTGCLKGSSTAYGFVSNC